MAITVDIDNKIEAARSSISVSLSQLERMLDFINSAFYSRPNITLILSYILTTSDHS